MCCTWVALRVLSEHSDGLPQQRVHVGQQVAAGLEQRAVDAGHHQEHDALQQRLVLQAERNPEFLTLFRRTLSRAPSKT